MTKREMFVMGVAIVLSVAAASVWLQIAWRKYQSLRESTSSSFAVSGNFPNWASLMIAAIAGAILVIAVILGLVVLLRPRGSQESLYPKSSR
jgi:hypothetical protein